MANNKYFYVVVNKENGKMILEDHKLPIYYNKKVALDTVKKWGSDKYCAHPIDVLQLEKFILLPS